MDRATPDPNGALRAQNLLPSKKGTTVEGKETYLFNLKNVKKNVKTSVRYSYVLYVQDSTLFKKDLAVQHIVFLLDES